MDLANHERAGRALEMLTSGLKLFVGRKLKSTCQQGWFEQERYCGVARFGLNGSKVVGPDEG
jgi:hypothetical protein